MNAPSTRKNPHSPGDVVGKLTLVRVVGRRGGSRLWEVRCACGEVETRSANSIYVALNDAWMSACKKCRNAKAGRRDKFFREAMMVQWGSIGSLYTPRQVDEITAQARQDSELPEPADLPPWPPAIDEASIPIRPQEQRNIEEDRAGRLDHAMTLQEVGDALGVSRERARQIEEKALAKFRRTWLRLEHQPRAERLAERAPAPLPEEEQDAAADHAKLVAEVVALGRQKRASLPMTDERRREVGRLRRRRAMLDRSAPNPRPKARGSLASLAIPANDLRVLTFRCPACGEEQHWATNGAKSLPCAKCGAELMAEK